MPTMYVNGKARYVPTLTMVDCPETMYPVVARDGFCSCCGATDHESED